MIHVLTLLPSKVSERRRVIITHLDLRKDFPVAVLNFNSEKNVRSQKLGQTDSLAQFLDMSLNIKTTVQ
jgi:hypothetical protein